MDFKQGGFKQLLLKCVEWSCHLGEPAEVMKLGCEVLENTDTSFKSPMVLFLLSFCCAFHTNTMALIANNQHADSVKRSFQTIQFKVQFKVQ